MRLFATGVLVSCALLACAVEAPYDPLADYEEVGAATALDAPAPAEDATADEAVVRGKYLVELLGCGSCHTDGALLGEPRADRSLAGSRVGVAYSNPLANRNPGIVFAPNLTPDERTGIGGWSEQRIADAIRAGIGRHGQRRMLVMPWQGYRRISDDDAAAIARYLKSLDPIEHQVPAHVPPGTATPEDYVHFGVYRTR